MAGRFAARRPAVRFRRPIWRRLTRRSLGLAPRVHHNRKVIRREPPVAIAAIDDRPLTLEVRRDENPIDPLPVAIAFEAVEGRFILRRRRVDRAIDVGERGAQVLADHFGSIEAIEAASLDELEAVREVGPVVAAAVRTWFDQPQNRELVARLRAAGVKVTLNSDDPPFFKTSLEREYEIASRIMGFSDEELDAMTRTAIEAAFVDEKTRARLLARL